MPGKENLYFIAIIPQQEVYNAVTEFKKDFAKRFDSERALRVMPHITLKAPFNLLVSDHLKLLQWFQNIVTEQSAFTIELKDFGAFKKSSSPVVFVKPVVNSNLLNLQKNIISSFNKFLPDQLDNHDREFNPHMTIAYRDLSFEKFKEAWREYETKKYRALFEVNSYHLLQHDSKKWNIIATNMLV